MGKTEPINPARKVNLFLKIWLYPNVSGFKIAKAIPSASNWRKNYHDKGSGFVMVIAVEMLFLHYIFPNMMKVNWRLFLVILSVLHGLPELFFNKQINEMTFDYYAYYNKALLYIFLIFMIIGFIGFCGYFYNQIGHLPAK